MSWHPADLVSDQDLLDYEPTVLTAFNVLNWDARRAKALEDWLWPLLRGRGFDPQALRTRAVADGVLGYTSAAYTDLTAAAKSTTADDLNLATLFATPASDALYVGASASFRGLYVRMLDAVSSVAAALTVAYWAGAWVAVPNSVLTGTNRTAGKPFSGGGALTWTVPSEWIVRDLSTVTGLYWVKVMTSAAPTGAKAVQVGVIRRSALAAPATLRTLSLIYRGAPSSLDGPWLDKAAYYEQAADQALERAWPLLGAEFETVADELLDATEQAQRADEVSTGWRWERA
jgi:hypothetical protein